MAGTKVGGNKAAETNLKRYGKGFYAMIGAMGGRIGTGGGFASKTKGADGLTGKQRARLAGAKGGRISTRKGIKNGTPGYPQNRFIG